MYGARCALTRKTQPHKTNLCLFSDTGMVKMALCTCTFGLGGCCNHVAALLYALEEFARFGPREKDVDSPTSRLCKWNHSRARREMARRVVVVRLQHQFGPKPLYNPVPPNKRLIVPEDLERLTAELRGAHAHALTTNSATAACYKPPIFLSAMEAMSPDSEASEATSSSDSGSKNEDQTVPDQLSTDATPLHYSPKKFCGQIVVLSKDEADSIKVETQGQALPQHWFVGRRE